MKIATKSTSMKKAATIFSRTLLAMALAGSAGAVTAAELTLTVSNIKQTTGSLYIRIYGTDSEWLSQKENGAKAVEVIDLATVDLTNGSAEITRRFQLPEGTYAATAIHDVNNNGKLDTDWRGVPSEPSGNSGIDESRSGPPKFETSKFELGDEGSARTIRLSGS